MIMKEILMRSQRISSGRSKQNCHHTHHFVECSPDDPREKSKVINSRKHYKFPL